MINVAVLMPTVGRPGRAAGCLHTLMNEKQPAGVKLQTFVSVPRHDLATLREVQIQMLVFPGRIHLVKREPETTAVDGWNSAYVFARDLQADWYVLGADDLWWKPGWLKAALATAEATGAEVIGFDDGGHTNIDLYAPHYMASRRWIEEEQGGFMAAPVYKSWWFDREVCERARSLGKYAPSWGSVAEHLHPDWGQVPMDDTYLKAWPLHDLDKAVYLERQKEWQAQHA